MIEVPAGWSEEPLAALVAIHDAKRIPVNGNERRARVEDKDPAQLFPYFGATGQVGLIDHYLFDAPLILLGEDGVPFLDPFKAKAYLIEGPAWVNNHAHVLEALEGIADRRYLAAFLNWFDYRGYVTGSTRLKLTQAAMRGIPVRLAPLPEQKRIADKLGALLARVDACRTRLDRVPALLKRFRQAVLKAATSGELTEDWRDQWKVSTPWLDLTVGAVTADLRYGTSKKCDYAESGTPVLRIPNIADHGKLDTSDLKRAEFDDAEIERLSLRTGDLLVIRSNGSVELVGKTSIVSSRETGMLFAGYLMRLRVNPSHASAEFLQVWLFIAEATKAC